MLSLAAVAATEGPPKILEAQEILVRDSSGNVRVRLGVSELISAAPTPATPSPSSSPDALDRVLDEPRPGGASEPALASTSIACLTFMGSAGGPPVAQQCSSWDEPAYAALRFRVAGREEVAIVAEAQGSQLILGGIRSKRAPEDRGRASLVTTREGAALKIAGPPEEDALLDSRSITFSDESGRPPRVFPGTGKR